MRFLLPVVALFFLGFIGFSHADLRFASSPKETRFAVRNRDGSVAFSTTLALYNEPATFGYAGLRNQRQNNYDNFLRSNIDNEQDNRNFNQEAGKDMLPFRTNEAAVLDETKQIPESIALTVVPGKEYVLPLRWNNPHASEMELNIWIKDNTVVVPIKKPVCAGEGYQDGVISFIVPTDFNDLITKVPGFNGCQKLGDCTLQMYAHSVEPRTYAAGTPIIVSGWNPAKEPKAANDSQIQAAWVDPGTDLSKQPNDVCLSSVNPASNIASAIPRKARQVSDVYNHAYQNSDYSPYSGQQGESISKTMQAASVLRMVNGNRGELGQSILTQQQKNTLANLRNAADNIVKNYETITNKIINQVLKNGAKSSGTVAQTTTGAQKLNNCFRCADAASVSANRLETNTYVPSFKIENANQLQQARNIIQQTNAKYANLINSNGVLQIYIQALADMAPAYQQLQAKHGLGYQPAMIKSGPTTMTDPVQFKKVNAQGQNDGGKYAATQAKAARDAKANAQSAHGFRTMGADGHGSFQLLGADVNEDGNQFFDVGALNIDDYETFQVPLVDGASSLEANADDDPKKQNDYDDIADKAEGLPIRSLATPDELAAANGQSPSSSSSSSSGGISTGMVAGIAGAGGALVTALIAGGIIYHQKKQTSNQQTNNRVFQDARV